MIGVLEVLADQSMVIDLAVDGEHDGVVSIGERLGSALYASGEYICEGNFQRGRSHTHTNNAESFMAKDYNAVVSDLSHVYRAQYVRHTCLVRGNGATCESISEPLTPGGICWPGGW